MVERRTNFKRLKDKHDFEVGKDATLEELKSQHDAFIATGVIKQEK